MSAGAFWNGLPTTAEEGTALVAEAPKFPAYWAADLVGRRIPVVRVVLDGVNHGGGVAYLDNRDGSGWRKVTVGHGSPKYGHRNVSVVPDSFVRLPVAAGDEVHHERRYTQKGTKAHLVSVADLSRSGCTPRALCGRWQWSASGWFGTGSQDEYEKAASLPLCASCSERAR